MSEEELRPWLIAFVFTQVIEVPLYTFALRRFTPRPRSLAGCLAVAFLASLLTLPVVWFVMPLLIENYWLMALCAETFAIVVEGALLFAFGLRRPWLWSLAVNALSALLGSLCRTLFGVP